MRPGFLSVLLVVLRLTTGRSRTIAPGARLIHTRAASGTRAAVSTMDGGDIKRQLVGRPLCTPDTRGSTMALTVLKSISEVPQVEWDACVRASAAEGSGGEPFASYSFLHTLEASGSVDPSSGWMVQHLVAHDTSSGRLLGAVPLYLKSHSYGEYVFDHSWARAYRSSLAEPTSSYYPKLQACIPFTPVVGARLLVAATDPTRRSAMRAILARGLVALAHRLRVSSVHVTFSTREESRALRQAGFLPRIGLQYHWRNDNYSCFDDYLASLKQSRRKAVRQERRKVADAGFKISRLRGAQITSSHWDAFYRFYQATIERKWGHDYLSRPFFEALGREMPQSVVLVLAEDSSGQLVAGALNLLGADCVYGRLWGCSSWHDSLHFELCYYQGIEIAIELGLPRAEAGAQGEHKIARGYLPTLTHSSHYLRDDGFRSAIKTVLSSEREQTYVALATVATQQNPLKRDPSVHLETQGVLLEGQRIKVLNDKP